MIKFMIIEKTIIIKGFMKWIKKNKIKGEKQGARVDELRRE